MNKPPIFVTGLPRSGTSLLALLISKHKSVEGMWSKDLNAPRNFKGYAESRVWGHIISDRAVPGVPWGSPENISSVYRTEATEDEKRELKTSLERARKTNKIPLVKQPRLALKVGFIKDIYPDAKFVVTVRNPENWAQGAATQIARKQKKNIEVPQKDHLLINWYTTNSIMLYDLDYYIPDQHYITKLEIFQRNDKDTEVEMRKIFDFLELEQPSRIDLSAINKNFQHVKNNRVIDIEEEFELLYRVSGLLRTGDR